MTVDAMTITAVVLALEVLDARPHETSLGSGSYGGPLSSRERLDHCQRPLVTSRGRRSPS